MSTHPNVILMAVLTPKGLARQTMRAIAAQSKTRDSDDSPDIEIAGELYHARVMESGYDDGMQIGAHEGDLVFFDFVTYGYGEVITWEKLEAQKMALEAWAKAMSETHHCDYRIDVTANYW